jgi:hypothetical protein
MTRPKGRTARPEPGAVLAIRRLVRVWPALTLVAVVAALYGPATGRYFTSEDFLLLRVLRERPPWQDVLGTVACKACFPRGRIGGLAPSLFPLAALQDVYIPRA